MELANLVNVSRKYVIGELTRTNSTLIELFVDMHSIPAEFHIKYKYQAHSLHEFKYLSMEIYNSKID